MKKRVFYICALLLCLVAGICLYTIPYKKTNLDAVMQATKLDESGIVIGTEEIAVQGNLKRYLFKEDTVELNIAPFGTYKSIRFASDRGNSSIPLNSFHDFYTFLFVASWDPFEGGSLTTSQDFEYWVFFIDGDDQQIYYVASASGERTVEEIVQFFKGLAPGYVSDTKTAKNN